MSRNSLFTKTIEAFNRACTVIPVQYGCTFADLGEIANFLELQKDHFARLLGEVDGCVEMSARVSVEDLGAPPEADVSPVPLTQFAASGAGPGIAYLTGRRRHYASREEFEKRCGELRKAICAIAEGTFIRCASEYAVRGSKGFLSTHFLVSRRRVRSFTKRCAG